MLNKIEKITIDNKKRKNNVILVTKSYCNTFTAFIFDKNSQYDI